MTTALARQDEAGQIDQALTWLARLQTSPSAVASRDEIQATVASLTEPANPAWVMARVLSLLDPYFAKDTPIAIREMEAEDWADALDGLPQWAIDRAVKWWKSAANPDRRKRPLEGDIALRTRREMHAVLGMQYRLDRNMI